MKAKIILSNYPYSLAPDKFYEIKGQSQIDENIYFITNDVGHTTSVDISQLIFLNEVREQKLNDLGI
jgi:hypothetical protein